MTTYKRYDYPDYNLSLGNKNRSVFLHPRVWLTVSSLVYTFKYLYGKTDTETRDTLTTLSSTLPP